MVTFIRKDLGYTEVDSDSELTELKMIKLRSYTSAKFLYICVLYPSPSSRDENNRRLLEFIRYACDVHGGVSNLLLIGDFNLRGID